MVWAEDCGTATATAPAGFPCRAWWGLQGHCGHCTGLGALRGAAAHFAALQLHCAHCAHDGHCAHCRCMTPLWGACSPLRALGAIAGHWQAWGGGCAHCTGMVGTLQPHCARCVPAGCIPGLAPNSANCKCKSGDLANCCPLWPCPTKSSHCAGFVPIVVHSGCIASLVAHGQP